MLLHRLFFGALLIAALLALFYADDRLSRRLGPPQSEVYGPQEPPTTLPPPPQYGPHEPGDADLSEPPAAAAFPLGLDRLDGLLVAGVLLLLIVAGTFEMRRLAVAAGHAPILNWAVFVNAVLLLITFHAWNSSGGAAADERHTLIWLTLALAGAAWLVARRRCPEHAIGDIAVTLLTVLYLGFLAQYLLRLRLSGPAGGWLLLYAVGVVKICDIGAWFTGRTFGRRKLIEWLSPGKTVEGLVGGIVASCLTAVLAAWLVRSWPSASDALREAFPGHGRAVAFGVLAALVGQAGDLLESLFKRDARVKDSAAAIPSFGGVLDILDSPLLVAPVACWVLLG